jgi:hypothetical protein
MKRLSTTIALIASFLLSACGPAPVQPIEIAGPNETVFVIPLEGDTTLQKQVQSVEYLNQHMVQAKRITIPIRERSTGRAPWDYEWLPTMRVIKVDRSQVTRQWVGTKGNTPGVHVQSLESISFRVGFNVTALIQEKDAATFLYWHGAKSLGEIVDTNVRSYVQDIASREFGALRLEEGKAQKNRIFAKVEKDTIDHFKQYGITIVNLGNAGGMEFEDEKIQAAINTTQTSQMSVQVAEQEKLAQDKRNQQTVATAVAQRQAAEEFAKAAAAQVQRTELDIKMKYAEAAVIFANKVEGRLPSIVPPGTSMLYGFDRQAQAIGDAPTSKK